MKSSYQPFIASRNKKNNNENKTFPSFPFFVLSKQPFFFKFRYQNMHIFLPIVRFAISFYMKGLGAQRGVAKKQKQNNQRRSLRAHTNK